VVLCGPLAWPILTGGFGAAIEGYTELDLQSNLWAFFLPSPWHPWLGPGVEEIYRGLGQNRFFFPSLGWAPLLLAVAGLVDRRTRANAAFWGFAMALFFVLCLGERLRFGPTTFDFWMPYRLIAWLPPLEMLRSPDRFNVLVLTALAPAAAWGLVAVQTRWPRQRVWLAAIAVGLVLFEYLPSPYPTTRIPISPFVRELAGRDDGLAVLELPLDRQAAKIAMSRQWVHGRPLVGGMVARQPIESLEYIRGSALLSALASDPAPPRLDCGAVPLREEYSRLRKDGIGWVVLRHRSAGRRAPAFERYFPGPAYHRDRLLTAWSLDALMAHRLPCDVRPPGSAGR
jgi:hypothetical protein